MSIYKFISRVDFDGFCFTEVIPFNISNQELWSDLLDTVSVNEHLDAEEIAKLPDLVPGDLEIWRQVMHAISYYEFDQTSIDNLDYRSALEGFLRREMSNSLAMQGPSDVSSSLYRTHCVKKLQGYLNALEEGDDQRLADLIFTTFAYENRTHRSAIYDSNNVLILGEDLFAL